MMPEGFWPDELSVKQVEAERLRRDKRNIRNETIEECARALEVRGRDDDAAVLRAFQCHAANEENEDRRALIAMERELLGYCEMPQLKAILLRLVRILLKQAPSAP